MWEKEKILVTDSFSFSLSVLSTSKKQISILWLQFVDL